MNIGIAQAEIGFPVRGARTYLRGQKTLLDLGKSGDDWEIHHDCHTQSIDAYTIVSLRNEPIAADVTALFRQGLKDPDKPLSIYLSDYEFGTLVQFYIFHNQRNPNLLRDPAFVQHRDLYNDIKARHPRGADVAIDLAQLGSDDSIAMIIFRRTKYPG